MSKLPLKLADEWYRNSILYLIRISFSRTAVLLSCMCVAGRRRIVHRWWVVAVRMLWPVVVRLVRCRRFHVTVALRWLQDNTTSRHHQTLDLCGFITEYF